TSCSTASLERPGASVWTSTRGGANSGKTSRGVRRAVQMPPPSRTAARATTATRWRSERGSRVRSMGDSGEGRGAGCPGLVPGYFTLAVYEERRPWDDAPGLPFESAPQGGRKLLLGGKGISSGLAILLGEGLLEHLLELGQAVRGLGHRQQGQ